VYKERGIRMSVSELRVEWQEPNMHLINRIQAGTHFFRGKVAEAEHDVITL
jgi:hypothetical protein